MLAAYILDVAGRNMTNLSHTGVQDKIYTYDLNGNMLRNGNMEYIWDDENRLVHVKKAGLLIQHNHYDGLSRRIEKIEYAGEESVTNRYVYDKWNVIAVLDGINVELETYIHGIDLSGAVGGDAGGVGGILSGSMGGHAYAYHYDGNGNAALNTGADGDVSAQLEYSPFGEVLLSAGTYCPRYQFSTKELDGETGLNYYGYRFYSAIFGHWLNRDPLSDFSFERVVLSDTVKNALHVMDFAIYLLPYMYVFNDPLMRIDLYGLDDASKSQVCCYFGEVFTWPDNVDDEALKIESEEYGAYSDPFSGDYRHCVAGCVAARSSGLLGGACILLAWDIAVEDDPADSAAGWSGFRGALRHPFTSCRELCKDRTVRPINGR